ncbi:MAG TPA: hypothetical protein DCM05_00830 [Elusimicrobia bacterium]|nr:hypothetical protein [Elusimicrobiota bacterium]
MAPRWTPLLFCLPLLCACGKTVHETEPNDHFTKAQKVPLGTSLIIGGLAADKDVDVFSLEPVKPVNLSLFVGGVKGADLVLEVQDKDRRPLKRVDETVSGGDEQVFDVTLEAGAPSYIVLAEKLGKALDRKQTYRMKVRLDSPEGREHEPDDKALQATPLRPGALLRGHYHPARNLLADDTGYFEEDWFSLECSQEGLFSLNADISEVPGIDPVLEVYDANGYKVKEIDDKGVGEPESLRHFGVKAPARFLLRLRSKVPSANAQVAYEILTELVPYLGRTELEPNDQRLDANPLLQDSLEGTLSPAGDADWFKVSVAEDQKTLLKAELSPVPGMDIVLSLRDDIGGELALVDNMGKEQPEVLTGFGLRKGDTYLVVTEKTGKKADPKAAYTLSKTVVPWQAGMEFEPNDSTATVQAMKVGETMDGHIAPRGDADLFEFNVYTPGEVVVEAAGLLNVRLQAALFDQDGKSLGQAGSKKPGEPVSLSKPLQPGTYQVELRAAAASEVNTRDKYTLRIRAR